MITLLNYLMEFYKDYSFNILLYHYTNTTDKFWKVTTPLLGSGIFEGNFKSPSSIIELIKKYGLEDFYLFDAEDYSLYARKDFKNEDISITFYDPFFSDSYDYDITIKINHIKLKEAI